MSEINIKKIRERLGFSQEELARKVGVSPRTVQNWEAGKVIPQSKHELLREIENEEIVLTQPPMLYGGEESEREHGNLIPFYDDVESIGGVNSLGATMDGVSQPSEYIDTGDWFRDATAAIRHYGDSMIEYPTGCILAIKEVYDRELMIPGRDYVIETSEYRITKKVQRGKDEEYIRAYSTNEESYSDGRLIHEPFDIPWRLVRRIFLVLGYVVKKTGGTVVFNNQKR